MVSDETMRGRHLDPSLVIAFAMVIASVGVVAPLECSLVVAVAVVSAFASGLLGAPARRTTVVVVVVALAAGAATALRCASSMRRDLERTAATRAAVPHPARCAFRGVVVGMPLKKGVVRADVLTDRLDCEGMVWDAWDVRAAPASLGEPLRVRLYDLPEDSARGDEIEVIAQLAPARRTRNPELGDSSPALARQGIALSGSALSAERTRPGAGILAILDRVRALLRDGIMRTFSGDVSPIARALVLGEEDLVQGDDEAFRRSGLTHLLAVSGSHVALVVGSVVAALRALLLRWTALARRVEVGRVAAAIGVPIACAYEQLAGDSGSARRATSMAAIVLVVRAAGRAPDIVRALSISVVAGLVADPLAAFDLSFSLSLAATLGLIALSSPIVAAITSRAPRTPRWAATALGASLAASAACAPLIARLSAGLPLLGLAANLVAVPIGEIAALPLANLAAVAGAIAGKLPSIASIAIIAKGLGHAASGAVVLLRGVARVTSAPAWSILHTPPPTSLQLAILGGLAVMVYVADVRRRTAVVAAATAGALLCLAEVAAIRGGAPRGRLRVTVLDIGQGDSTLIDFPDGRSMLIDGGGEVGSPYDPGKVVVSPMLAARRRRRVDIAVLSHPHPDHFLGLASTLPGVEVGAFWDTGQGEGAGEGGGPGDGKGVMLGYHTLLAGLRARATPVLRPDVLCGAHPFGGAVIEVLHPCPGFDPARGANDNSFVLRIGFGRAHALLVGDAERAAEATLLRDSATRLRADFLKVGHHGSRTSSSPELLRAVSPAVAAISCGVRNRFGHPHARAIDALRAAGVRTLRTDLEGSIRWTTDGESTEVATARAGW